MRSTKLSSFFLAVLAVPLNTAPLSASPSPSASPNQVRLTEPSGGFSYSVPEGWQVRSFPGTKFRYAVTVPVDGFSPNIGVNSHQFASSLSEYVRRGAKDVKGMQQRYPGFHLLGQSGFVTSAGLHGIKERAEAEAAPSPNAAKLKIRLILYCFAGHGDQKLVVTVAIPASVEGKYAPVVDSAMKSFTLL